MSNDHAAGNAGAEDSNPSTGRLTSAGDTARRTAGAVAERGRAAANRAAEQTGALAADNPLALVAGGALIGLVVGLVAPMSRHERRLGGPMGARVAGRARGAIDTVKQAGMDQLRERNLHPDALRDQVKDFASRAADAAKAAANSAVDRAGKRD